MEISNPFLMNQIRPTGSKNRSAAQLDQKIPQGCWIKNASVIDDDEIGGVDVRLFLFVTQPQLLGHLHQFVEGLVPFQVILMLEPHQIFKSYSTMTSHLLVRKLSFVQKFDEVRPRDVEKVSRLLSRHFGMDREQSHRTSPRHLL